ncbi:MAG: ParB/RepB/Spo0J family partition protein [Clostridia bacterium]|nr:ParB/RepB/Spo0J family partition protein [Clostridia bacterium]
MGKGLGRGLDALFQTGNKNIVDEVTKNSENRIQLIHVSNILTNEDQPRKIFDEKSLSELANSIKKYGIIQPLVVTKKADKYDLVAGERRLRAAKSIGLESVPVVIKEYNDQSKNEISLIENIQREDLNTLEVAEAYKYLMEKYNLNQEELAKNLGKSRSTVANSLRILKLTDDVKEFIKNNEINEGHCKILASIPSETIQKALANKIVADGLSVRQLENLIKEKEENIKKPKKVIEENIWIKNIEDQFKDFFQTKVQVKQNGANKGKIIVEYYSNDELESILNKVNRG